MPTALRERERVQLGRDPSPRAAVCTGTAAARKSAASSATCSSIPAAQSWSPARARRARRILATSAGSDSPCSKLEATSRRTLKIRWRVIRLRWRSLSDLLNLPPWSPWVPILHLSVFRSRRLSWAGGVLGGRFRLASPRG